MRVLMLGWEYPPKISGGLGVASQALAESLSNVGQEVSFLLPSCKQQSQHAVKMISASDIQPFEKKNEIIDLPEKVSVFFEIGSRLLPYLGKEHFVTTIEEKKSEKRITVKESIKLLDKIKLSGSYGPSLMDEILKYGFLASQYSKLSDFDVVHCHDWMTFKAGEAIHQVSGLPWIAHFHSIEYERNGPYAHPEIETIEKNACQSAHKIVTVSKKTADLIKKRYQVATNRIQIIPNGYPKSILAPTHSLTKVKKIGFVGRFTFQKNPKKFIDIARSLISYRKDVSFIMIGDGHQMEEIRNQIRYSNLESKFELSGFLSHTNTLKKISQLDVLIVPSNQEPFGLVPLEAVRARVPVIASEGCGITEFIPSMKTCQSWNDHSWTQSINHLLDNPVDSKRYTEACWQESEALNWHSIANKLTTLYQTLTVQTHA